MSDKALMITYFILYIIFLIFTFVNFLQKDIYGEVFYAMMAIIMWIGAGHNER